MPVAHRDALSDLAALVRESLRDATDLEIKAACTFLLVGVELARVNRNRFPGLALVISHRIMRDRG